MLRSLYSSITGLRNHQVSLDVIGNNISNVNTTGFKAGRVTFKEAMSQLLQGASRPYGSLGGTNPIQMGLGMAVGSIDASMTQGNLESTGKITDLAIEGDGYFVYGSGDGRYYSRMGAMQFDGEGTIVSPTNGFALQGKMANEDGTFEGQAIGNIKIPFGDTVPANATTEVQFAANLDSDSEGLGTVLYSQKFLSTAFSTASVNLNDISLTSLHDSNGNNLGMRKGDIITISCNSGGVDYQRSLQVIDASGTRVVGSTMYSYQDMIDELNLLVNSDVPGSTATATIDAVNQDGSILLQNNPLGVAINNLQITSNRPGGSSGFISRAFSFPSSIPNQVFSANSDTMRRPAAATDLIANLYDSNGNTVGGTNGLEDGAELRISGAVGGDNITPGSLTYTSATSTLQDLLDEIRGAYGLPLTDGTTQNNLSISINNADTKDDNIPDGSIVFRGQPEMDFALTNVAVIATDPNQANTATPTRFNANLGFIELRKARDTLKHSTSIVVYDETGDAHTMTTMFTRTKEPGKWLWEVTMEGGETLTAGNSGVITFAQDGSPNSFTSDDQSPTLNFDPMNGSNEVRIDLNVGAPGSFRGITQFRAESTAAAKGQDGYKMGKLRQISINEFGTVAGSFTNGINKDLAQIYLASFNNPGGLMKMGDSMYSPSSNSGSPLLGIPQISSTSSIKPGALELSNVELATEFTNMITTQRGFQANARVITTSDEMLNELVQLVR